MKWVLASSNTGKLAELKALLQTEDLELISQQNLAIADIEETGLSFIENALLKARHAATQSGYPALADDSGLVIDALQGAPGIYSARYAGQHATMEQNIEKVLHALEGVPFQKRTARFYCVLALVQHGKDPLPRLFQGQWEGIILDAPKGAQGFGYDPVFFVPEHHCSAAQLSPELKQQLSHRGKATNALRHYLKQDHAFV